MNYKPPKYYVSFWFYEHWIEVPYGIYLKAKSIRWVDTKFTRVY